MSDLGRTRVLCSLPVTLSLMATVFPTKEGPAKLSQKEGKIRKVSETVGCEACFTNLACCLSIAPKNYSLFINRR